jgi:hypothetical protein
MTLQPLPGFCRFPTHHCITGSLRHMYAFNDYPISEEMLLGLGAGVGFVYWHMKGALPFMGGRANIERPGIEGLEKTVGRRTGVHVQSCHTSSPGRAEQRLLDLLHAGQPVMLILDMGYLPYFDFGGTEFHFGYHAVVACGYDSASQEVLLADRDEPLHAVPMAALRQARGSTYKPFPPQHGWYEFDFSLKRPFEPIELRQAISEAAQDMLEPPITNLGVKGIRKAARRIPEWPLVLEEKVLREACINTAIMIDARGGTGGGLFRYMYARFLQEAAKYAGLDNLKSAAGQMQAAGDCWQEVATLLERAYQAEGPAQYLESVSPLLLDLAQVEQGVWERLIKQAPASALPAGR